jgi:hypothetical protein
MQQRQLRLGDILDDYCPRERRVTNHAVVAMVGEDVKQTRCTTCDTEHEFKHAKIPRQRRKADAPAALYSQVLAGAPKHVVPDSAAPEEIAAATPTIAASSDPDVEEKPVADAMAADADAAPPPDQPDEDPQQPEHDAEEGPAHRRLIRATLPRPEGQAAPVRPVPEFTIRQPAGRQGRFRPRNQRGSSPFHSGPNAHRSGNMGGGMPRQGGGRPPMAARGGKHHGPGGGGRKRSK